MSQTILTSLHGRRLGLSSDGDLIVNTPNGEILGASKVTTITSAQLLALNATPIEVVPAPGAGLTIYVRRWAARIAAGTAYAGIAAGEDLVLKYTDGSGAQAAAAMETTGFLDQTTAQYRVAGAYSGGTGTTPGGIVPVANAAIVAQLLVGEITTGTSDLIVKVWYDVLNTAFTS